MEEEEGEGGGGEEDPGGGEGGGREEKHGRRGEKDVGKEKREGQSAGRVRLRGALLQTYILSILIRSIMEVTTTVTAPALTLRHHYTHSLYITCSFSAGST